MCSCVCVLMTPIIEVPVHVHGRLEVLPVDAGVPHVV